MGNCKPRVIDTDSKYYFNDIDDMATEAIGGAIPENINNASMEQRVSLTVTIKNVDITTEHKVELITYSDSDRKYSKSVGFTENKAKNIEDNIINFQ